ncbi:MAG: hypothetical protein IKP95_04565 [Ruminococcus sp.]|nr:hypothetical protein [Ruminococcus sp.]
MNKNKGLVIELTSLLDVILIMLFWVMMVSSDKADQKAQEKIDAANAAASVRISEADSRAEQEIKAAREEAEQKVQKAESQAERLAQYADTVEGFQNGEMLSISITYVDSMETLSFARSGEQISSVVLTGYSNIEYEIRRVLDSLPNKDGIILAAFVYDGNTALYRDVEAVRKALEGLRADYEGIYFAYINTSGKS